ncbi:MAG: hypothetical protein ACLR2G_00440 [Phascolarctobacterium faecium]
MKIFAKDKVVFNFSKANQPVYFVEPEKRFGSKPMIVIAGR